jgi:hypothetical protein
LGGNLVLKESLYPRSGQHRAQPAGGLLWLQQRAGKELGVEMGLFCSIFMQLHLFLTGAAQRVTCWPSGFVDNPCKRHWDGPDVPAGIYSLPSLRDVFDD